MNTEQTSKNIFTHIKTHYGERTVKIVNNFSKLLKMLTMLVLEINCFECLFTCPGLKFLLTEEFFYTMLDANTFLKNKNSVLKMLRKSDKMNLTF